MVDPRAALALAVAHHQAGRWNEAEPAYRAILRDHPNHPDAVYLLGTLCFQTGRINDAASWLERAVAARPNHPESHNNLGLVRDQLGQLDAARDHFRRAIALSPGYADAHYNLANLDRRVGQLEDAVRHYQEAIRLAPAMAAAHDNLALCYRAKNQLEEALYSSSKAVAHDPGSVNAWNNRGAILKAMGRYPDAAEAFGHAIELEPRSSEALSNLAVTLAHLGRWEEAEARCRQAIECNADGPVAWNNLAIVLHLVGRDAESAMAAHRALELAPGFADAFINLGNAFLGLTDFAQAERAYQMATERDPNSAIAWSNLGSVRDQVGQVEAARECFEITSRLAPEEILWELRAGTLVPPVFPDNEAIFEFRERFGRVLERFADGGRHFAPSMLLACDIRPPFHLQFHGQNERRHRELYAAIVARSFPTESAPPRSGAPRIGFLVTHGHEWAFYRSIGGCFEHFQPGWLPIILCSPQGAEKLRSSIRNPRVEFVPLPTLWDGQCASIAAQELDLIYHWEIATSAANYLLPYCRLAPLQLTSWGIQITSGIPALEYYVSSELVEPPNAAEHYTEKLVRLATTLSFQRRILPPAERIERSEYGLADRRHLYLCAQHLGKFQPDFDPIVRRICELDPLADIVITRRADEPVVRPLVDRFARTLGPFASQIRWIGSQQGARYHNLVRNADVVLDPIHFGGVNTTYDALSQNKAVVCLPGPFHRGRYTLGCLQQIGVLETVANSADDYATKAVRIATDSEYRIHLEAQLAEATPKLFECVQTARELEAFLLHAVELYRREH